MTRLNHYKQTIKTKLNKLNIDHPKGISKLTASILIKNHLNKKN